MTSFSQLTKAWGGAWRRASGRRRRSRRIAVPPRRRRRHRTRSTELANTDASDSERFAQHPWSVCRAPCPPRQARCLWRPAHHPTPGTPRAELASLTGAPVVEPGTSVRERDEEASGASFRASARIGKSRTERCPAKHSHLSGWRRSTQLGSRPVGVGPSNRRHLSRIALRLSAPHKNCPASGSRT